MSCEGYFLGQTVRIRPRFTDAAGAAIAATGVQVRVRRPDGTSATPALVTDSEGQYADIITDLSGAWWVRVSCVGPVPAAYEEPFQIRPTKVP